MPLFFFDIYDGHSDHDQEGTELQDVAEARQEAIRLAGALLHEKAQHLYNDAWRMEVRGSDGRILLGLQFSVVDAAVDSTGQRTLPFSTPDTFSDRRGDHM